MKIFLLIVTILFLFNRIKKTPQMLDEKLYRDNLQKSLDDLENSLKQAYFMNKNDANNLFINIAIILSLLTGCYYGYIGILFASNNLLFVLSGVQIATVVLSLMEMLKGINYDVEDYKFHKWYFLFNVVMDYIYYPLTIYMLLTN